MKRTLTIFHGEKYLALILLAGTALAHAQSSSEMQEVLSRLDRLEKGNQALTEEIRALRQELAARRADAPEGGAATVASAASPAPEQAPSPPAGSQTVDERLAVQQSRIDELAQTKVEASERFPIRLTGTALFNAYRNGRNNNSSDNPTIASAAPQDETGGATLRQSTIGLLFSGPQTVFGGKVSGSLYMDFFSGSSSSLNHVFRLRTATINLDWANTSVLVGQDKPLISPRDPQSLAQVGISPLTGAGNLWLWQPQIRFEHRITLSDDSGLRLQAAAIQTKQNDTTADFYTYRPTPSGAPSEESNPGGEARLEFWRGWSKTGRLEIAGGLHVNRNHVSRFSVPTNVYSLDWFFRPLEKIEFSGSFYHGRNVAVLGALPQGFTVLGRRWLSVASTGGWAQLAFPLTSRITLNVYGGQQDDRNSDLRSGDIGKNQAYFSNLMYRFAPNVIVSLEGGQVRTTYLGLGNRSNDHYDLGVAYLF